MMEGEEESLQEIFQFYANLFKSDLLVTTNTKERLRALSLIDKMVKVEDNRIMIELPIEVEIETMVRNLLEDKSPNIDSVTTEILQ